MRLFFSPNAMSRVAHIALEDAGADFELVLTDTRAGQQRSPDYLAVNPKGRVPALETDRGVLTETPAILAYIAQSHPEAQLAPLDDPFAFARMQALIAFLSSSVSIAFAHHFRPERYTDQPSAHPAMATRAAQALHEHFSLLESQMRGPWACGPGYTVADPYLFVMESWLDEEWPGALARYPKLSEHARLMRNRPFVQKVIAVESGWPRN